MFENVITAMKKQRADGFDWVRADTLSEALSACDLKIADFERRVREVLRRVDDFTLSSRLKSKALRKSIQRCQSKQDDLERRVDALEEKGMGVAACRRFDSSSEIVNELEDKVEELEGKVDRLDGLVAAEHIHGGLDNMRATAKRWAKDAASQPEPKIGSRGMVGGREVEYRKTLAWLGWMYCDSFDKGNHPEIVTKSLDHIDGVLCKENCDVCRIEPELEVKVRDFVRGCQSIEREGEVKRQAAEKSLLEAIDEFEKRHVDSLKYDSVAECNNKKAWAIDGALKIVYYKRELVELEGRPDGEPTAREPEEKVPIPDGVKLSTPSLADIQLAQQALFEAIDRLDRLLFDKEASAVETLFDLGRRCGAVIARKEELVEMVSRETSVEATKPTRVSGVEDDFTWALDMLDPNEAPHTMSLRIAEEATRRATEKMEKREDKNKASTNISPGAS